MDNSDLLDHILSQTRQNVVLLISQNKISTSDGQDILAKLQSSSDSSAHNLPSRVIPGTRNRIPPPPPLPAQKNVRARALWNYNENGEDPNDLTFRAGDIIEIVTEMNEDWWTGRFNGKQGLVPSNYVEKLTSTPDNQTLSEKESIYFPQPQNGPPSYQYTPTPYPGPIPNQGGTPFYNQPPPNGPPPNESSQVIQPPKKGKFGGKLGGTLAQSAAGGVGFGAGAAIGSGIINSIF